MATNDFQSSKLLIVITWDEGNKTDNHIPTLLVAKSIHAERSSMLLTHCSTLRTTEDMLGAAASGLRRDGTVVRSPPSPSDRRDSARRVSACRSCRASPAPAR